MALSVDTGQVAANTGSATTTITVTAQGKAIILWTTGQTSTGSDAAANAMFSIGFADGTNVRSEGWASDDNVGTTNCGKFLASAYALRILSNGAPTTVLGITGVTFTNATTTTLTWEGTPAAAYLISYMQLGGSDITNVLVGTHTMSTGTGDKTETGVGFEGDFGMFLFAGMTSSTTTTRANASIGFACKVNDAGTSRARQFGMAWGIDDGANMTTTIDAVSYTNSTNFLAYITDGAETIDVLGQFGTATVPLGFASNGFRYNLSNASATNAQLMYYLIIQGGQWDAGTTTMPSSATRTVSGLAFTPNGLALAWGGNTANATVTATTTIAQQLSGFGAATSTSTEAMGTATQVDAVLNTQVQRWTESTKIAAEATSVDFSAFASGEWSINAASSNDAVQLGWFVMADNAVVFPPEDTPWERFPIQLPEPIITVF